MLEEEKRVQARGGIVAHQAVVNLFVCALGALVATMSQDNAPAYFALALIAVLNGQVLLVHQRAVWLARRKDRAAMAFRGGHRS